MQTDSKKVNFNAVISKKKNASKNKKKITLTLHYDGLVDSPIALFMLVQNSAAHGKVFFFHN